MAKTKKDEVVSELHEETLEGKDLEKATEAESLETAPEGVPSNIDTEGKKPKKVEKTKEEKLKALKEKAEKILHEKVEKTDSELLKEEVKVKKKSDMLIDLEDYVKTGIYLGTRIVTPEMRKYIYRRRADGLAIFNTDLIDEKLKEGIEYLSKFEPENVILVCRRQSGWRAAMKFGELTGIKVFTKKYPAGVMTNTNLKDFFETELAIISDQWLDKNALKDTLDVHKKVLMICGTNNFSKGSDQLIIGNNKSGKSLGLIFYLLARGYLKAKGKDTSAIPDMEWWIEEDGSE
ncbi:hypothetical protein CO153_02505 [Candidatus Pacearchaeota archaeon CG_4_9_14_3_um_filter_30_11]|nr:MAG: hypothetical protein COV77_01565 [Candidatus Pacearchaeota archaeon CG11_big_fil_rev_8_21_14_0_20_30_13]PIZ82344.1 MAG: hypothetical protein COX98_00020 [Candidatus Pacearchaeota archaeon CG_4_10_14_0_2_um_filter_30_11]PJA71244.1 MAG: hypothetical protein CO153_02505 [Candidatus Pacearchaeota archaeon CG_4_9_14_3_um_filter_30_11]